MLDMRNEVEQAGLDGIGNIVPLILCLKKDPAGLKKAFGKGLWRKLAKASSTQNMRIAKAIDKLPSSADCFGGRMKSVATAMITAPAWIQDYWLSLSTNEFHVLEWLKHNAEKAQDQSGGKARKELSKESKMGLRYFYDSCRMANQIGVEIKVPKNLIATKKWHKKLIELTNNESILKYDTARFENLPASLVEINVNLEQKEQARVTFLTSPALIASEGFNMRHCIATRIDDVRNGKSVLAHITTASGKASAEWCILGGVRLIELSGRFNETVSEDCFLVAKAATGWIQEQYAIRN